jgi:hypothetical protein
MADKAQNKEQEQEQKLTESAMSNLNSIEDEIETSSQYFKPREGKVYMLSIDPERKIEVRLNERFKTADGKPTIRYEFHIRHTNSGKEQIWETSKTLCSQLVAELKKGFKVLQLERFGDDRGTVYKVKGLQ